MFTFRLPFFFILLLFSTTTAAAQPYKATDIFFLNCGSSTPSNNSSDQSWVDDEHSNFVPSNFRTTSSSSNADCLDASLPRIPYSTARVIKTSSFTYKFPVSQGPKFLRLHFYPSTYSGHKAEQSFFSVSANGYSLLTNFSAFLTLSFIRSKIHENVTRVVKEFLIYVKDTQTLNVTFTPSQNSYAFINGIEIVSMPENLYFNAKTPKYVNMYSGPDIDNDTALENIYRLNMGGGHISANDDTGMYRSWDPDNNYLHGNATGLTPVFDGQIMYTLETPNYTAPDLVYRTQRSMGNQSDKYFLSWIFPVDPGFHYMLRLHFCNIIPQYTKSGQVIFIIYFNTGKIEQDADPFYWTQGSGYPVFRDYIVFVSDSDGRGSKQFFWLAMQPNYHSELYLDAYLNGLEVFKLSMDKNLAGANPEQELSLPTTCTQTIKRNNKKISFAVIIGGIGGALVLLSIIVLIVFWQRRRVKDYVSNHSKLPTQRCRRFSLAEVKAATDEFNDQFVIGNGGFGKVYKGYMDNATTIVAIKRLNPSSSQGFNEFRTEIALLSKLRHVQLVSLIGYCDDVGEMILVYEYMAHGTLREHLYNTSNPPIPWKRRLDICIGAAKGLHYLHTGNKRAIIHRDVKSTNILLNENWVAKVSDFGLSKLGPRDQTQNHVSTVVKGSLGYVDPQYFRSKQLTDKSDVYSFGVVLLEVLCARPVRIPGLPNDEVSLAGWGKINHQNGTLHNIIDSELRGVITPECLRRFGEVAVSCLKEEGSERPAMDEVVWGLEFALELQEAAERTVGEAVEIKTCTSEGVSDNQEPRFTTQGEATNITDDDVLTGSITTIRNGTSSISSSSEGFKSETVFSEILNPPRT